ncbi:hypothetical protein [Bartonella rattimassiliensis]|uniref:hypothetical protein n=1 Tax=Bartonella rattimassiliensis TaxID=270250 RepID=UPI00031A738E|nr:hypothetical protein [Bartonella rattimassiliensis]
MNKQKSHALHRSNFNHFQKLASVNDHENTEKRKEKSLYKEPLKNAKSKAAVNIFDGQKAKAQQHNKKQAIYEKAREKQKTIKHPLTNLKILKHPSSNPLRSPTDLRIRVLQMEASSIIQQEKEERETKKFRKQYKDYTQPLRGH